MTPLKRVNYFSGQLLTAADFRAEQHYFLERQRLHNRFLLGFGVVGGLKVTIATLNGTASNAVHVEPGMALDCLGDELVVGERLELAIPSSWCAVYVGACRVEIETDFVPRIDSDVQESSVGSRIEERTELSLLPDDPCADHARRRLAAGMTCGARHPISLARLSKLRGRWCVDRTFRPRRARMSR